MTKKLKAKAARAKRVLISNSVLSASTIASAVFLGLTPGMGLTASAFTLGVGALGFGAVLFSSREAPELKSGTKLAPLTRATDQHKELKAKTEELYKLAQVYESANSPLFSALNGLLVNLQELFSRMTDKTYEQSARIAAVRYTDTLTKLNTALGKNYYLDIEANPELWSHPDERMAAVEKALNATGEQILRNIRQLNSSKDLIYQVSVELLMGAHYQEENNQILGVSH